MPTMFPSRRAWPRRIVLAASLLLTPMAPAAAQDVAPLLASVDSLLAMRQLAPAVAVLEQAARAAPADYDVLWRQSRVQVLQGDAEAEGSRAQDRFYRDALATAERAVKARGGGPDGLLRRAAAAGKVALFSGVLDAADFVVQARKDAEAVIALRDVPAPTLASAHYILGRTHLKLTETPRPLRMPLGLGFGNLADAVTNLRRATELRPGFIMFELELARALAKDGKTADARERLTRVASLAEQELGDEARKEEAAVLLRTLR